MDDRSHPLTRRSFRALRCLPLALLLLAVAAGSAAGQTLRGVTRPGTPPQVLLLWSADTSTPGVRYNIYRRALSESAFTLLTPASLAPVSDCAAFQAIIPRSSAEWSLLAAALSESVGNAPPRPFTDVCAITTLAPGTELWRRVQAFVAIRPNVARAMGQAYEDRTAASGTTYIYRVARVAAGGELPALPGAEDTVTAGAPDPIPAPAGVRTVAGDAMVQILWQKPAPEFGTFNVYRAESPGGPFSRVNDVEISADLRRDIDTQVIAPPANGFTDYERYDSVRNNPTPRAVDGVPITGPANGRAYYYQVAFKDLLGNVGPRSAVVSATPRDRTAPATPQEIIVEAVEARSGFEIRWPNVRRDVNGHPELTARYRVYRYENPEDPAAGAIPVGGDIAQPAPRDSLMYLSAFDATPGLRNDCGDKTWYFRVEALDERGNISHRSIAVGAALKDTTRPKSPRGTGADGYGDYIRVRWDLSHDCDIDNYLVYRALCDYGDWVPCDTTKKKQPSGQTRPGQPAECGGPFALIGSIPHAEAERLARDGVASFDDRTVPAGSPLCYAYLVKAQDHSQNISGRWPLPDRADEIVVCQRLRDRTPPEPAVISGLFARDSAIRIEFIGPPVQDIAAYHVYRSTAKTGPYEWVGGVTVATPPAVGALLDRPYRADTVGCRTIPLASRPYMSAGVVTDRKADPKQIYWYKVVGIDQNGNEAPKEKATAMSTFTFASNRDLPPSLAGVAATDDPCALTVSWSPLFDRGTMAGFVVFRSTNRDGPYHQLESVVTGNSFADNAVARNRSYWYRVALLHPDGSMSRLSDPREGVHP